jgi:SAM-dependent methyltransferase
MPDFSQRSYTKELLDRNDIPFADIRRNMQELDIINSRLGGHAITITGFKKALAACTWKPPVTVCEIGCGGGDNLKAIHKWCQQWNVPVKLIGIDINPDCISYAKENCSTITGTEWIVSDYQTVQFPARPLIIFSSLFCHHFNDDELVSQLQWMKANSSAFFINDLHRHPLAYQSIRVLTRLFSKSYLVRNDAPLSVLRGFTKDEWKNIFRKAGMDKYEIEWKWAFRWLITAS